MTKVKIMLKDIKSQRARDNLQENITMNVYIIHHKLTSNCEDTEEIFFNSLKSELDNYVSCIIIKNTIRLSEFKTSIKPEDLLIIFNGKDETIIDENLLNFIEYINKQGTYIIPIAMKKESRTPISQIKTKQSFDVEEELKCRDFGVEYVNVVATIFARNEIISRVKHNIYSKEGLIFISHRREDGEDLVAKLCDNLLVQYKHCNHFRDVTNVQVGCEAQEKIDESMNKSDAFIFLHTPKANTSEWIKKELYFAIIRKIPILWVNIDNASNDGFLFLPSEKPHIKASSNMFHSKNELNKLCDNIIEETVKLIIRNSDDVYSSINELKDFVGINSSLIDKKNGIYSVETKRKNYRYHHRDIKHIVQLFGRSITDSDIEYINFFTKNQYSENIDSIILLSSKILKTSKLDNKIVLESFDNFFDTFNNYLNEKLDKNAGREIIISGAFPDSEEAYKQVLTDVLIVFASQILKDGYTLTFGSHPTFQELFFEISRMIFGDNNPSKLKMFISKHFEDDYKSNIIHLKENATTHETKKHDEGINRSLTIMRQEMIQRGEVTALVCVGGKRKETQLEEGVREEISLAIEKNIPVFIVGTAGGCSAVVASEYMNKGWESLNTYSSKLNEDFKNSLDYKYLVCEMIKKLNEEEIKDN